MSEPIVTVMYALNGVSMGVTDVRLVNHVNTIEYALEQAIGRTECDNKEIIQLQAENKHLKSLIEEILVENVGCTELRNLYRKKMISNQETKRRQVGE